MAIAAWAFGVWLLLTWTVTAEQLIFGGILALLVAVALNPIGRASSPVTFLLRLPAILRLAGASAIQIVKANVGLARRILSPSRPLASGMIIVPSGARTAAEAAATGLITSLIVDNQIVDLDRQHGHLQYHAVAVPEGDRAEAVNRPTERLIRRVAGRS